MSDPIEKCSCEESVFLRRQLHLIVHLASTDTQQAQELDLLEISTAAHEALWTLRPGSENRCGCDESLHYRAALSACLLFSVNGKGRAKGWAVEDVAQCNNVAHQGLQLATIKGDPGLYDTRRYITQL